MPTSLSDIKVKNSTSTLVIKPDDITINGVSIVGQNSFADKDLSNLSTTGQAILNAKANNSDVVHKTGNETVSGLKTFNDNMISSSIFSRGQITLGTSANMWGSMLQFQDTAGKRIGRVQPLVIDTSTDAIGMWVNNADNTKEVGIWVQSNGEAYAPHPPSAQDSSNKIATTAWVNNLENSVVHKAGNETITGLKTIDTSQSQSLITKSNIIDNSVTPTSTLFSNFIDAYDINNVLLSRVFTTKTTGGANGICIQAWKGSTNYGIQILSDGSTHAPSSITHTVGNIKVSTDFQVVSALPANPVEGIFYFVKE